MKYRTIRDCRPLTPIEEGEGDEDEDGERALSVGQGSDQGPVSLSLIPCDSTMRPWGELMRDGTPSLGKSLSHTLNRLIDSATIKVVGFEESFGSRLSQEARSLTWSLCEVYGKARMAIDLVEKELLTSRQEIEVARQEFEEMASAESDLLQCVRKARSLTAIAVEDVARWRREYRRALDDNANLKLKMIRYQLHHDMMESSSVEVSHQNHSIKAFINICREKEKQCQRSSKNGRCIPRAITLDNPVNGRNSCAPRKHCPKVNLSLPRPGQSALQGIPPDYRRKTTIPEKKTVEKNTSTLSWNSNQDSQDEDASPTASLTLLADTRPHQLHYTGSTAVTPDITFHLAGTAPISSPESSGDRASDAFRLTSVPQGRGKEAVAPRKRTRFEPDVFIGLRPGTPRINRTSSDTSGGGRRVHITFQGDVSATRKESSRQSREDDSIFPESVTASPGPFSSPTKLCGHTQDEMKPEVYTTPSTCRYSPIPDVVTTESAYNPTINDRNHWRQHSDVAIGNRDYSFHRNFYSYCSSRCFSPVTPYRSPKLKRTSSCVQERPLPCGAAHHESCTAGDIGRSKSCVRESVLPVPKVQNYPSFLPPIPCRVHRPYHGKGTALQSRAARSFVIKDKKIASSLPMLGNISKSSASKSAIQKHMSEIMRPQQRSISRQVLPRVSSAVAPSTVYHQVLLIRSCPTEIMGKATSATSNSSKMYDNRCKQSINI